MVFERSITSQSQSYYRIDNIEVRILHRYNAIYLFVEILG